MEDYNLTSTNVAKEANMVNAYDSALKQLVQILKNKATDNLKQLEDLWDSINCTKVPLPATIEREKIRASPTLTASSLSPLNRSSDNSNDSTSSSNSSVNIRIYIFMSNCKLFY